MSQFLILSENINPAPLLKKLAMYVQHNIKACSRNHCCNGNPTMRPLCCSSIYVTVNYTNMFKVLSLKGNNVFHLYCWATCRSWKCINCSVLPRKWRVRFILLPSYTVFRTPVNNINVLRSSSMYPTLLSHFNQILDLSKDFHESCQNQISRKSVQGEPNWYIRIDRRADMMKLVTDRSPS
jgi:hypothetical protein